MSKLLEASKLLKQAIKQHEESPENKVLIAGVIKTFEVLFEYVWKEFKKIGEQDGREIYSPRDAIKSALEMNLVKDFDIWKEYLNTRNLSVHDYLGVGDKQIIQTAKAFQKEVKNINWPK